MSKKGILRVLYYFVFGLVIAAFYVGLRSDEYKVEYTVMALVLWGVAYLLNKWEKKIGESD